MNRLMTALTCAGLMLTGAAEAQTAGTQTGAAESARRFLTTAIAACNGVRLERETFDQARLRLGLSARDAEGISKKSLGNTPETIVQTNLGFRTGSSGALMCSGAVSGLNLPAEGLSRFTETEIERVIGIPARPEGQPVVSPAGARQSMHMLGDQVMMMLQWDPPAAAGSDDPVTALFIISWMPSTN